MKQATWNSDKKLSESTLVVDGTLVSYSHDPSAATHALITDAVDWASLTGTPGVNEHILLDPGVYTIQVQGTLTSAGYVEVASNFPISIRGVRSDAGFATAVGTVVNPGPLTINNSNVNASGEIIRISRLFV